MRAEVSVRPVPRHYYRDLLLRGVITVLAAYMLTFGGTFTGVLLVRFQHISLVLLSAGVLAWLVAVWITPVRTISRGPLLTLALWGLAYGVAAWYGPPARAATGTWWAAFYAAAWLLAADLRRRGLPVRWMADAVMIALVPVMLIAVLQIEPWFSGWLALDGVAVAFIPPRPPGTLGNANAFGSLLAMTIPFALDRVRWSARPFDRVLVALWLLPAGVMLYLTFSRGAWIAAAVGIGVYLVAQTRGLCLDALRRWWATRGARIQRVALVLIPVMLAGVIAFGLLTWQAFDTPRRETGTRLTFLRIAWDTFRDAPLTGRGPLTYGLSLLENWSFPPDQPHAHAHNLPSNVAAELGLVGVLALVFSGVIVLRRGWFALGNAPGPGARAQVAACTGALSAVGVHSMVDAPLLVPAIAWFAVVLLALVTVQPEPTRTVGRFSATGYRLILIVVWAGVLGGAWWSYSHTVTYTQGARLLAAGDYPAAVEKLRRAADAWPDLPLYHAEYGYACGLAASAGETFCLDDGIAAYRWALEIEPQHALWWANLAVLYDESNQHDDAIQAMQEAASRAPGAADLWLNLGIYLEAAGEDSAALETYRRALDADADWAYTGFWQTTPLRESALAESGIGASVYHRALALWQSGDTDKAVTLLEATIDRDPSQPKPYVQLARLHIAQGELERAQPYIDAARLLAHTDHDDAWNDVVDAEYARAIGDEERYQTGLAAAREKLWPDETGYRLPYGLDVTYFQFWRVRVGGVLLPQLVVYSPDPELVDYLGQPALKHQ